MSTLSKAHEELQQRAWVAEERRASDRALLASLVPVADYLRRIGENHSAHYRADKAGELVAAALRAQRDALVDFAGDGVAGEWVERLWDVHRVADSVVTVLVGAMWATSRGQVLSAGEAVELRRAAATLERWAGRLCEPVVSDGEGAR